MRFAPSPTGRFHIGNLRTAWISHHLARELGLEWVVRFEDIDTPRVVPGARETQLADMAALGLHPDLILTQSEYRERHWQLLRAGIAAGQLYACDCSRREVQTALAGIASAPHDGTSPVYTGVCRRLSTPRDFAGASAIAWRFRMPEASGRDDFVVARTSGSIENVEAAPATFVPAYHWACAIDDYDGEYDLLARSSDLAPAVAVQRAIHSWVAEMEGREVRLPAVFHTALVVRDDGSRLEKRTGGVTLPELEAAGYSAERVNAMIAASMPSSLLKAGFRDSDVVGEAAKQITLAGLGVRIGAAI